MTNKQFHHNMTNLEIYDKLNELFDQIQTLQQTVSDLSAKIKELEISHRLNAAEKSGDQDNEE